MSQAVSKYLANDGQELEQMRLPDVAEKLQLRVIGAAAAICGVSMQGPA